MEIKTEENNSIINNNIIKQNKHGFLEQINGEGIELLCSCPLGMVKEIVRYCGKFALVLG